jgi:iron complex outermembrane receptor protein
MVRHNKPYSWLLLLGVLSWTEGMAQEMDSVSWILDPVVVTGTRYEQPRSKIVSSVSVVDRESLERNGNINVLPALVRHVPGFFLNDRSITGFGVGPNSGGNISIRGISGTPNNRVLVLIDGQPQFMGIFAHPIADAYSATDIERVEVIRGAASVLYGSNAMGGAINMITRRASEEGWQGDLSVGYGSYGTALISGNIRYKKEKFHAMVSANRNSTKGYRADAADNFSNTTTYVKLGYDISPVFSVSGDLQLADAVYFQPGPQEAPLENDEREYLRGRAAVSLKNEGEKVSGAMLLYHNFGNHRFSTGFESTDQNQGLTFYQNLNFVPGQVITLGLDYKRFGGRAFNETLPPPAAVGLGTRHWVDETDVYIHIQQSLAEKLNISGGIRQVNNSQFGSRAIPAFGVSYQAGEETLLKASSSKAFRSPSVVDLFLFPPSNEDLQPEELWSHEFGVIQRLMDKSLSIELTLFYTEGKNLIQINPMEVPPIGSNSGSFTNKGLESQISFKPKPNTDFTFNYAFVDVSANVLFAPRHHFGLQGYWSWEKFTFMPSVQQVFGLRNSIEPAHALEDYTLLNIRIMYYFTSAFRLFADARNLTNTHYQVERGYPMPGFNMIGGLSYSFK